MASSGSAAIEPSRNAGSWCIDAGGMSRPQLPARRCLPATRSWVALLAALLLNASSLPHPSSWLHRAGYEVTCAPAAAHLEAAAGGIQRASVDAAVLCAICLALANARAGVANLPELRARHMPAQRRSHTPHGDSIAALPSTGALPASRAPPDVA